MAATPEISLAAEQIAHLGGFPITNSLLLSVLVTVAIVIVSWVIRYQVSLVPSGFYNAVESVVEGLFNLAESVFGSFEETKRYFPIIAALFIFILLNNWAGLIPGVGPITIGHVPILRGGTADLNTTLALAIISVGITQYYAAARLGFFGNVSRFFNFKSPILFFVGVLELVAEFAKVLSFSFRLFGNIFAGEVVLLVMAFLAPYLAPLPFIALELFVGLVQALVFAMLTLVFLKVATAEAH
ncbi:F0F1 ATP synthase subunit A [Candidatus Berkelbacteria bacterium]|nr:F0F1 ATP synthase subunit A [Candidatus Berkelbacteria bacterium]